MKDRVWRKHKSVVLFFLLSSFTYVSIFLPWLHSQHSCVFPIPSGFWQFSSFTLSWINAPCSLVHLPLLSVFPSQNHSKDHIGSTEGSVTPSESGGWGISCWKWTRRSFNLVKKGDSSSSLPPPLSPSICPCTSSPSSSLTSPHTLHGSETESGQVSVLFTWTLGNVKVCLVWTQVRTISFLTLVWFTWPLLPLSVSALNLRPLCVWLMQRAFLGACLLQSSFTLALSLVLFQWASMKGAFAESVSVCTANSEVPSSNMVLRVSLSRPLLLVDIISTLQSFFSQSHSLWSLHLHWDQYFPNPQLLGWPRVISWLPMLPAVEVKGQMAV